MSGLVTFALFAISAAKYDHIGQHLGFQDVFLGPQIIQGWDLFSQYTNPWLLAVTAAGLPVIFILGWRERPLPIVVATLCFIVCFGGFYSISSDKIVPDTFYGSRAYGARPWNANSTAEDQGLLAAIVTGARVAQFSPPPYDQTLIQSFTQQHPLISSQNKVKPDIILWLGESFFDPGIFAHVDTCDPLPTFCNLLNASLSGSIKVPTFGGNTTRTEFEVLTAVPFKLLGSKDYPYSTTVHNQFDSIAWSLKAENYHNVAIHPHDKTFWQRDRALPLLGFDEYLGRKDFNNNNKAGYWISDASLAQEVIDKLDASQPPTLLFAISMEGHGPYGSQKNLDEKRLNTIPAPEHLDATEARMWREYIYHAQNTAHSLTTLKNYIDQRKRPTLLVFFGDHLPGMKPLFKQMDFDNLANAHQQSTPVLALANYPIASNWLPQFSYEVGLWTLELAGNNTPSQLQELGQATSMAYSDNDNLVFKDVVKAMQARQISSPAP
ncbi:LTA synthase family protein [Gilvimarinus polysaccharolyticus]|uniref:LTA synthase family protein n=1 Tax=Gilvimarinus polysaccharolyticus TaxID=863921 RepID=UPI0006732EF2|nr:LTA synthase family protein [Gilvimarinus polysaccharolyticus]